jgi:hypothetical protein
MISGLLRNPNRKLEIGRLLTSKLYYQPMTVLTKTKPALQKEVEAIRIANNAYWSRRKHTFAEIAKYLQRQQRERELRREMEVD